MFEAIELLERINGDYLWMGYQRAKSLGFETIGLEILNERETDLSRAWFTAFLQRNGINVKTPEKIERTRVKYCHANALRRLYDTLIASLPPNPSLLFNADETAASFNNKGKVVVPKGKFPCFFDTAVKKHYTAICCFNADGTKVLRPFIILPGNRSLPEDLKIFRNQAFFASSASG